ncbi:hypothetical protein RclHR1_04680001, partial [Rhizophagus clarus]
VIILITYQNCYHLTDKLDLITPETISYDPNIYNNLIIDDFNNVQEGEIIVSQNNVSNNNNNNDNNNSNATLTIRLATIKNSDSFTKSEFQDSKFNLQILRKSFPNSNTFSWLGYLSIPPKCISARLELTLPPNINAPSILQINSKSLDIELNQELNSPIQLITSKGDVNFRNNSFTNQLLITTNSGDIYGNLNSIQSTTNELNINTDDGSIQLNLNIIKTSSDNLSNDNEGQSNIKINNMKGSFVNLGAVNIQDGAKSPNIYINSGTSDISIKFNNSSFNGNYEIYSSGGKIKIEKGPDILSQNIGNIGDFTNEALIGRVNISSTSGVIDVKF